AVHPMFFRKAFLSSYLFGAKIKKEILTGRTHRESDFLALRFSKGVRWTYGAKSDILFDLRRRHRDAEKSKSRPKGHRLSQVCDSNKRNKTSTYRQRHRDARKSKSRLHKCLQKPGCLAVFGCLLVSKGNF